MLASDVGCDVETEGMSAPDEDIQTAARNYLRKVCEDEFGKNVAAMAEAMEVSRSTLWKVLEGDRGLNNLDEWEVRFRRIGHDIRVAFGVGDPDTPLPSRAARLLSRMPERVQAAMVAHLEAVLLALQEAGDSEPIGDQAEQLLRDFESMSPERRAAILQSSAIYAGRI